MNDSLPSAPDWLHEYERYESALEVRSTRLFWLVEAATLFLALVLMLTEGR